MPPRTRKRSLKNPTYPCERLTSENPFGSCQNQEGKAIYSCETAPDLGDCAQPLAENICRRVLSTAEIGGTDRYKAVYRQTCLLIEQMLGFSETRPTLRDSYFKTIEGNLQRLIEPDDRTLEGFFDIEPEEGKDFFADQGRAEYHVSARLLESSLGAFSYRADYGPEAPLPEEIVETALQDYADILADFETLYASYHTELATKRTEIILMLLELYNDKFPYPSTVREESSNTSDNNHDYYYIEDGEKVAVQVKATDYRMPRSGKPASESYNQGIRVAIYRDVVGFTQRDETIVTHIEPSDQTRPVSEDEPDERYEHFDPDAPRGIRWSPTPPSYEQDILDEPVEFIQRFNFTDGDPLIATLIKYARKEPLSEQEQLDLDAAAYIIDLFTREKK